MTPLALIAVLAIPACLAADNIVASEVAADATSLAAQADVKAARAPYLDELIAEARRLRLWTKREWRLLLHYRHGITGTYSDVFNREFFISPRGRNDPQKELEATLAAFLSPSPTEDADHPQCVFRARFEWLKRELRFDPERFPTRECRNFLYWSQFHDVEGISLVFAAAHLNNPSSMYGHTLFLLHRRGTTDKDELLNRTLNYAADVDTNNGVLFAIYGLTGRFPGRFSFIPMYLKVQQYNNLEDRDMWLYRLNLNEEEIARFMRHVWELEHARFHYYFFNKNCSFQPLTLLEVARPELHLTDHWPIYVIPANTVRDVIGKPGMLIDRQPRPSHRARMIARRETLSKNEIDIVESIVRFRENAWERLARLAPERQAAVLDSSSEYLEYLVHYRRNPPARIQELQLKIHVTRGRLGIQSPPVPLPPMTPPESGHKTTRLGFALGEGAGSFSELSLRLSLHDLLDRSHGYVANSTLELGGVRIRHSERTGRVYLHGIDFVRIVSLSPWDRWYRKKSWKVSASLETAEELGEPPWRSRHFRLNLGSGATWRTSLIGSEIAYALLEVDSGFGRVFRDNVRVGGGATAGLLLEPAVWIRLQGEVSHLEYALGDRRRNRRYRIEGCLSPLRNLALRLRFEKRGAAQEKSVALQAFF